MRFALRFFRLVLIAWLVVCAGMAIFQRKLLYWPQERHVDAPLLRMPSDAGEILVSVRERPGAKALLYFGGNAEDASLAFDDLAGLFPEHSLYLLHYRGFGGSAGEATEASLVADAMALFDSVQARHANISVIGRSLGSGVAMQLAAKRPLQRLALVTPFDSVEAVAGDVYPWLPVRWLLVDKFDSQALAPTVKVPTLMVIAGRDRLVTSAHSRRLAEAFSSARLVCQTVPEADHDDIAAYPAYGKFLQRFIEARAADAACAPASISGG